MTNKLIFFMKMNFQFKFKYYQLNFLFNIFDAVESFLPAMIETRLNKIRKLF